MSSSVAHAPTDSIVPRSSLVVLALPVVGLALLLAAPDLDVEWQHHPSHFWLVLSTAAISVALAYVTNVAAERHRDARIMLVSLAFLASAGFLGLHALATPGVLLAAPNTGFALATPVGLIIAAIFAAASVSPLAGPRADLVHRHHRAVIGAVVALLAAWAVVSLAGLVPLNGPPPGAESVGVLRIFSIVAIGLYGYAAWRYLRIHGSRGDGLSLAVGVAFISLGEATLAVAFSRNWHLSWWEWHVLMLAAFVAIALGARDEYRRRRSLSAAFGGLYSEATLARIDRWHARAIASVAAAEARHEPTDRVLDDLRQEGASDEEIALLAGTARELHRLDALFRPYLPAGFAEQIRRQRRPARLGGEEREVTVLFADLAGFTTFSERRRPTEVINMLNRFWAVVVPAIERAGGSVEHFAGDGVMVVFNAAEPQPDHAARGASAALAIAGAGRAIAAEHQGWPVFRVGVNTGPVVIGSVGAQGRRSFAAIGDTTNVAARLVAKAKPGALVVSEATWRSLDPPAEGRSLGPLHLKGKRDPVPAWVVTRLA